MLADLDLLLTSVFCTADDLLPERAKNARRSVTEAEVVTLAVAQAMIGIDPTAEFLAVAAKRLGHLFPNLPKQPGYWKRRARLTETIESFISDLRQPTAPASRPRRAASTRTPVECGRSLNRQALASSADACGLRVLPQPFAAGSGGCACTCSPHPDGTPRA